MKLPTDVMDRRVELYPDTMNNAYFLYCYLEIGQRYQIKNYQIIRDDLNSTILENKGILMKTFRYKWTVDHKCDISGCGCCIVIDAGNGKSMIKLSHNIFLHFFL